MPQPTIAPPTPETIRKALLFDPIAHAEKVLPGSQYAGLSFAVMNNDRKRALLEANNDTHWGQTVEQFQAVLTDLGFERIQKEPIEGTKDWFYLFWQPQLGILLRHDTYWDHTTINSANIYANLLVPRDAVPDYYRVFEGCSGRFISDDVSPVYRDAREGLRYWIDMARPYFQSKWSERPFLWLLNYNDVKDEGYNYRLLNAKRIAMLPAAVQVAITPLPPQ